jgi:glutathionylspermidine synthase
VWRHLTEPRRNWRRTVESQGLIFPTTTDEHGVEHPYWFEGAWYELTEAEVEHLEDVTERLHRMSIEAARFLATGEMGTLGLPEWALELALADLDRDPPSLYGRFDLRYDGTSPALLLEYNADTPTGLIEASVAQWYWAQDKMPSCDQFNSLHERLVRQWQRILPRLSSRTVHFAHARDPMNEEWITIAYLLDTAREAGLETVGLEVQQIGFDHLRKRFVDLADQPIATCFKLYAWENMLREEFGRFVRDDPQQVTWLEPIWKVLLSNKALLAAMWHLYPGDENLLPAYLDAPGPLTEWVAKPLHGREGDNIRIHAEDVELSMPGPYGFEGWCYQQWAPLPDFDGNKAVVGSWVVNGRAAGVGIRESDSWVTDTYARFVPHVISAPQPDAAQRAAWLAEDDAPKGN